MKIIMDFGAFFDVPINSLPLLSQTMKNIVVQRQT